MATSCMIFVWTTVPSTVKISKKVKRAPRTR